MLTRVLQQRPFRHQLWRDWRTRRLYRESARVRIGQEAVRRPTSIFPAGMSQFLAPLADADVSF